MPYCVDTSAWIDAVRDYNPASRLFDQFWRFIEGQIGGGVLIAPEEVLVEMRPKTLKDSRTFAALIHRVQARLFVKPEAALQARFKTVLRKYPDMTLKGKPLAKSDGDAWVIALAQERGAVVVAHETRKPSALRPWKIPMSAKPRASAAFGCPSYSTNYKGSEAVARRTLRAARTLLEWGDFTRSCAAKRSHEPYTSGR